MRIFTTNNLIRCWTQAAKTYDANLFGSMSALGSAGSQRPQADSDVLVFHFRAHIRTIDYIFCTTKRLIRCMFRDRASRCP